MLFVIYKQDEIDIDGDCKGRLMFYAVHVRVVRGYEAAVRHFYADFMFLEGGGDIPILYKYIAGVVFHERVEAFGVMGKVHDVLVTR